MKIVRNTPEQLILQSVPWVLGVAFIIAILAMTAASLQGFLTGDTKRGVILFLAGPVFMGLFFAMFVRRDDLILDRSRNLLELRHATVFGRRKVQHELAHLKEALVQTQQPTTSGSKGTGNAPTHRVALVLDGGMDAGTHPATEVYTSGRGAERAAELINSWLNR